MCFCSLCLHKPRLPGDFTDVATVFFSCHVSCPCDVPSELIKHQTVYYYAPNSNAELFKSIIIPTWLFVSGCKGQLNCKRIDGTSGNSDTVALLSITCSWFIHLTLYASICWSCTVTTPLYSSSVAFCCCCCLFPVLFYVFCYVKTIRWLAQLSICMFNCCISLAWFWACYFRICEIQSNL